MKTLNAPFTFITTGPAGFAGAVYAHATSTGLPSGSYSLVYKAGSDPTIHRVPFSF